MAESMPAWARSPLAVAIERAGALAEDERARADLEREREAADVVRAGRSSAGGQQAYTRAARTHARAAALHDAAATLQQLHRDHLIAWSQRVEDRPVNATAAVADEGFPVN